MTWANKTGFFLICTTIVATTLAYGTVHQPVLALFYLTVLSLVVLWAVDAYLSGAIRFSNSLLQIPLFAAGAYALVQVIPFGQLAETAGIGGIARTISLDPFPTQVTALHFLALAIFFAISLVFIDRASRLRKVVAVITLFGFAYAFFAILQSFLSPDRIYGIYGSRFANPFGSFVNRHNFAAYIEMTMCLPLGMLFASAVKRDKRLLYITATSLMGIALLLSGSRGGFVALLAGVMLMVLLTTEKGSRRSLALRVGAAILLVVAVVGGAIFVGGESSLTRFAETAVSADISTNRMHIWGVTLKVIAGHLPFGAGFGAFGAAYTPFDNLSGLERVEQAHNDYLQVLADGGIVGLLIGLAFLYWFFRTSLRNAKTSNTYRRGVAIGAFAGCFAILVHSLFDFVLHTTAISVLFLTLIALIVASGYKYDDDIEDADPNHRKKRRSGNVTKISEGRRITTGIPGIPARMDAKRSKAQTQAQDFYRSGFVRATHAQGCLGSKLIWSAHASGTTWRRGRSRPNIYQMTPWDT